MYLQPPPFLSLLSLASSLKLRPPRLIFLSPTEKKRRTEQSTRMRVLRLPNSMPRTVHLCALLLFLCSSTSCFGSQYEECLPDKHLCGDFEFAYPFGRNGSGCGDPAFQLLSCDSDSHPLIKISGNIYHILEPLYLGNNGNHSMRIVSDDIWAFRDKLCDLSVNYSQSWWYDPQIFHVDARYTKVTFWRDCPQNIPAKIVMTRSLCEGREWYYSLEPYINLQEASICETQLQLPIEILYLPLDIDTPLLEQGFEITWSVDKKINQRCAICWESNGTCGSNSSEPFLCYCPDDTVHPDKCPSHGGRNKSATATIIGCSIGGAALIAIAVVLFFAFYGKRRKTLSRGLASGDMETAILPRRQISNLPIFSYEELRQATNCFNEENELGDGGFGSVYLGKLSDGRTVAVKRLYQDNSRRLEQFLNEVHIFSTLNHPRVVRLYGCTSADSPELLLVYEFVSNGTLADHLHGDRRDPRGLPWDARLNIAIQTAEALDFLHSVDPPIFHRDVKSTNILLDENLNVKVADFGLCRLVPVNASHVTTAPQGTPGYVDPEYHQCYQLTEKSDVYSFGVVLLEIISAKLAVDINRNRKEISLANMAKSKIQEGALNELVDPQLGIEMNHEVKVTVSAVAELALRCLASERDYRPHMKEVVAQLREIKQSWDTSTGPGDQQWGSFSNTKESLSPISVQDKWSSKSSTPNASA